MNVIEIHQHLPKIFCQLITFLWLIHFLTLQGKKPIFSISSQNSSISMIILLQCPLFCFHEEKISQEHTSLCLYSQTFELTCIGTAQSSFIQLHVLVFALTKLMVWDSMEQKTILLRTKFSSCFFRVPLLQLFLFVLNN